MPVRSSLELFQIQRQHWENVFFLSVTPMAPTSSVSGASDWKSQAQYWRGFESPVRLGIFLPESASSADSLTVSVQPACVVACINICVHVKNLKHGQPYHCLDTQIMHTLIGMGSAALAAAVPYPGKATRISCKGQRSTKQNRGIQC